MRDETELKAELEMTQRVSNSEHARLDLGSLFAPAPIPTFAKVIDLKETLSQKSLVSQNRKLPVLANVVKKWAA